MHDFCVRRRCTSIGLFAAAIFSVLDAGGCALENDDPDLVDAASGEDDALTGGVPEFTDNAVVVAFNQIAFDAAVAHDGFQDFAVNLRGITMMHLAIHDALNSILPIYRPYALFTLRPLAHPTAAAAQAAHDVLVNIYPDQQATFDAELAGWLARVRGGVRKRVGIELGHDAAAAIIAARTGDRMDVFGEYAPRDQPGDYQFVPPFDFVFRPAFGDSKPFALVSGEQFRAPPPPDLTSAEYAVSFDETAAFGVVDSTVRSEDQSQEAQWWFEFAEVGWNRITNLLARQRGVHLYPAARMFALVNMGIIDAYVAIWNAKQFYDTWRPVTAIRASDADGNDLTDPDPTWESFLVNPPTQEYPSAHAIESAAAAEMLVASLGTDSVSFSSESTTAPPDNPTRSFTSIRAAAEEAADSRIMAGIHFRFSTDAGLVAGRQVAQFILTHELKPRW